jgi:hypothetical protein
MSQRWEGEISTRTISRALAKIGLNWCRRLSKDDEVLAATSETSIYIATIRITLKRLA